MPAEKNLIGTFDKIKDGLYSCSICGLEVKTKSLPIRHKCISQGLGDTIAKTTSRWGIKPCKGCKRRRRWLNKLTQGVYKAGRKIKKFFGRKNKKNQTLYNTFERVYVVNLNRRKDRLKNFFTNLPSNWPFKQPEVYTAIDGTKAKSPSWWKAGRGAWGCYRSHLNLIEKCLNENVQSVLLLEDDAKFPADFPEKVKKFLANVPDDWGMIYLGGQHLKQDRRPPKKIKEGIYKPFNVNRTHAFALRGPMIQKIYKHLTRKDWIPGQHIDHHLGRLHQRRTDPIYCPEEWLVGQAKGKSSISGRTPKQDRFWKPANKIQQLADLPLVVILGLHSSGSSALAGILWYLGLHLGNQLGGYYGTTPGGNCGYEAKYLSQLLEQNFPFPTTDPQPKQKNFQQKLKKFIHTKQREAKARGTIACIKYPQLALAIPTLLESVPKAKIILSSRSLPASVESIIKRSTGHPPEQLREHQLLLHNKIKEYTDSNLGWLEIEYDNLTISPQEEINRLTNYLELTPTTEQLQSAIQSIHPNKNHHLQTQPNHQTTSTTN